MLPFNATLPSTGLGLRNNINGIFNDLRTNSMLMGVNQNSVASLLQQNTIPFSMNLNNNSNKDSQWLTLEVCREYQRSMCPRNELECKYAHPPAYIETQNGRVMCCYDSIKGKCHRVKPPCKYLHPPQHLKDLLIQNGKNNLLMKNLQMNIMHQQLSTLSGASQPRLGFLSVNNNSNNNNNNNNNNGKTIYSSQLQSPSVIQVISQKTGNENHKFLSSPGQTDSISPADQAKNNKSLHDNCLMSNDVAHPQTNPNKFSNLYECQLTQCLPNNISPGTTTSVSTSVNNDAQSGDSKNPRKRPLSLLNSIVNKIETSDKAVPLKKLNLLDTQLAGIGREQQNNQLNYLVNPLMGYQNQLALYLSMNNQSRLPTNSLNLQALLAANNGGLMPMGSSLICPNPLINVNGFPFISTIPNQQQIATNILQAANAIQYSRALADFSGL